MADETKDEYKLVEAKLVEMKPVFDRNDTDEDLYFLKPYEMMGLPPNQAKVVEDVANITLNDPLLFTTKSIAIISGATMQTVVEGRKMKDPQTTPIEQFLEDFYYAVDEWLINRGIWSLGAFVDEQICVRGRTGARSCVRLDGESLIPDVMPLDTRYLPLEMDDKGMVWGAPTFTRSKTLIEREYPGAKVEGDTGEVVDFWDSKQNVVFVDKEEAKRQPNSYGYPPFVYVIVPTGSMFGTSKATGHKGESILWANRNLWPEMNRTATILQTLNIEALFGGLQYESEKGIGATKPKESPYGPRKVVPVEKGGGFKSIPFNDIKNATRLFYSVLEGRLQRGSLSAIDYGTLTFPLSAIAITRLSGSRDDIFLPRIQAKALFYQALSRMIINQCIALGKKIRIGREGSKNEYTAKDLEGDYTIKFKFFTDSAEQQIANLTVANAAQAYYSPDTIRREVLKLKDPDGEKVKWESAQAERVDEVLFLYRRARSLLEEKNGEKPTPQAQIEARILKDRIVTILKQRQAMGQLSPIEKKEGDEVQPGKGVIPLLGEGGGGGGQGRGLSEPEEPEETKEAVNA